MEWRGLVFVVYVRMEECARTRLTETTAELVGKDEKDTNNTAKWKQSDIERGKRQSIQEKRVKIFLFSFFFFKYSFPTCGLESVSSRLVS